MVAAASALLLLACDHPPEQLADPCSARTLVMSGNWQAFSATDWACGTLTVTAPAMTPDERLALVLINTGSNDFTAHLELTGTAPYNAQAQPAPGPHTASNAPYLSRLLQDGHDLSAAHREQRMDEFLSSPDQSHLEGTVDGPVTLAASPAVGDARSFCVYSYGPTAGFSRRPATLRSVTPGALLYVTDDTWNAHWPDVLAQRPDLWAALESYLEGTTDSLRNPTGARRIFPASAESFGAVSDVDANGRVIMLFADLGQAGPSQFPIGHFDQLDVMIPADLTADCSGTGSNGADLLYLLDPWVLNQHDAATFTWDRIFDQLIPNTIAHELQHDILFNERCPRGACTVYEELWLNEALAMVAEDVAGFGLQTEVGRQRVAGYLRNYGAFSLTEWPAGGGDAVGNYGGVHALLRWYLDQAITGSGSSGGAALTRALVSSGLRGKANLEAASGLKFEEGLSRFTTATLFSGESFGPRPAWDFSGAPWSPWHTRVGYADFIPLSPSNSPVATGPIRADGWRAYVTGVNPSGAATISLTLPNTDGATVILSRFRATLTPPP
jgi:hypothetical protein